MTRFFDVVIFVLCLHIVIALFAGFGILQETYQVSDPVMADLQRDISANANDSTLNANTPPGFEFLGFASMAFNAFNNFISIVYQMTIGLPNTIVSLFPGDGSNALINDMALLLSLVIWLIEGMAVIQYARGVNLER